MKKLFENKDKDLFEFIIYFLFIIRKSFIRKNTVSACSAPRSIAKRSTMTHYNNNSIVV